MKRTPLRKIGKKGKEWLAARAKLTAKALKLGIINEEGWGKCEDCNRYEYLTMDHIRKRSAGGKHSWKNIAFVCWPCHDLRDNFGKKGVVGK